MERKRAIATAAIVSGAVFAASAAIGVNIGLLSSSAEENNVGQLDVDDLNGPGPTTATSVPEPVTVVVDEYVTDPAAPGAVSGRVEVPGGADQSGSTSAGSPVQVAPFPATGDTQGTGSPSLTDDDGVDDGIGEGDEVRNETEAHEEREALEGHEDDD